MRQKKGGWGLSLPAGSLVDHGGLHPAGADAAQLCAGQRLLLEGSHRPSGLQAWVLQAEHHLGPRDRSQHAAAFSCTLVPAECTPLVMTALSLDHVWGFWSGRLPRCNSPSPGRLAIALRFCHELPNRRLAEDLSFVFQNRFADTVRCPNHNSGVTLGH